MIIRLKQLGYRTIAYSCNYTVPYHAIYHGCFDLQLCPRYRSCLPEASHLAGFGIVTSVTPFGWSTCSFCGQTRPSASEVSPSRLLSSGTHFHLTSAHHSTVADSSDQSWKLIFSDKPTTLHDSSANYCLRVKLCNCNHIRLITVCIADIRRIQLSPYPNEFTSKKNNRIVKDARFDFILNSNINCNKK